MLEAIKYLHSGDGGHFAPGMKLRHMLYTIHSNHQGQDTFPTCLLCVLFIVTTEEVFVSQPDNTGAWCEPQHHNCWLRGAAGKIKILRRCFEQAVLCTSPEAKVAAPAGRSVSLEWHSSISWQGGTQSCWGDSPAAVC